jgi:hypothetical protein
VVAVRRRNLSVYDMQPEFAAGDHRIRINALTVLLREEGFARPPRRRDEERPATIQAESGEVADVRRLDLSPRSFRTAAAGLFLFVPLLDGINLNRVVEAGGLAGSKMIPAEQAVRSLLALTLSGTERKSHVMDLIFNPAIALFAGLKLDLDFHTVPANTATEPLEERYVSSRGRRQQGILVFLARDAEQRAFRYANAGIPKAGQSDEILRFIEFWERHTGKPPAELIFDSRLTTHANLSKLNAQGIGFITPRRRSRKMLADIYSRPASAWQRITLDSLTRTYRTPRVLDV